MADWDEFRYAMKINLTFLSKSVDSIQKESIIAFISGHSIVQRYSTYIVKPSAEMLGAFLLSFQFGSASTMKCALMNKVLLGLKLEYDSPNQSLIRLLDRNSAGVRKAAWMWHLRLGLVNGMRQIVAIYSGFRANKYLYESPATSRR